MGLELWVMPRFSFNGSRVDLQHWAAFRAGSSKAIQVRLCMHVYGSSPGSSNGKETACNAEDLGSISGWGRSPGEGNGNPLQYSGLENSMDCIVHGVAKSQT